WPDADPDVAAHRLHVAVSALRHALERSGLKAAFIRHDEGGYTARKDLLVTDCDLFDRWYDAARRCMRDGDLTGAAVSFRKAIALYGGDYFADLPYAEWTHQARARYLERRMGALTFLCDQAEREGDYLEVVEHARAMLGADSLREVGHRHLMRAHYRLGQRGVAIRQYNLCCELLQRELGVGPSRLTRALYAAIRDDRELPEDHARAAP